MMYDFEVLDQFTYSIIKKDKLLILAIMSKKSIYIFQFAGSLVSQLQSKVHYLTLHSFISNFRLRIGQYYYILRQNLKLGSRDLLYMNVNVLYVCK